MTPRLHYRLLLSNLILIGITVLTLYLVLNPALRGYLEQQIERQLRHETEVAAAYFLESRGREQVDEAADRLSAMLNVRVTVVGFDGRVLGDSELDGSALHNVENHGKRPEIRAAATHVTGKAIRRSGTTGVSYMYFARRSEFGFVRLAMPLTQIDGLVRDLRSLLFYSSILALALTLLLSYLVALKISRPIREITLGARKLASGDLSQRLLTRGRDEIASLAASINTMAENLSAKIRELSAGKQRLEQILGAMTEGILVLDRDGKVGLANRSVGAVLGSRGEILGKTPNQILGNEDLNRSVETVIKTGQSCAVELTTESGRVLRAHLAAVIADSGQLDAIVIVFHDLTEIRRTEMVRRDFVANVSHEFKTPLTSIRGYTETLLSEAGDDPETRNDFLRVIERNARHLETLVRDLLVLGKLEAELPATKEKVDVCSIVAEHLSARQATINERNLMVTVNCAPVNLQADPSRLAAAISNLIDNAISYNRPDGEVRITARMENGTFRLDVSDTGCGIPPHEIPRIFERFYRVDKARSRDSGGTGLGLSIAKHAVESQGGRIIVESRPGLGSTFSIRL